MLVVGFYTNQSIVVNISCIFLVGGLSWILTKNLRWLEEEAVQKAFEAEERKRARKHEIIDAEDFTVCD